MKKSIEQLTDELFDYSCFTVTTCTDTVRGEKTGYNGYIQRSTDCDLWKVYHAKKGYCCGMDTIHDAFRALQLIDEISN